MHLRAPAKKSSENMYFINPALKRDIKNTDFQEKHEKHSFCDIFLKKSTKAPAVFDTQNDNIFEKIKKPKSEFRD